MKKAVIYTAIGLAALGVAGAAVVAADTMDSKGSTAQPAPAPRRHQMMQKRFAAAASGARLGVQITDITEELRTYFGAPLDQGVLVAKIEKDSPAEKAGVEVGDVIVSIDGAPVGESMDVINILGGHEAGDKVPVVVVRDGKRTELTATVAEATDEAFGGSPGGPGKHGFRMRTMDPNRLDQFGPGFKSFGFGFDTEAVDKLQQRVDELEKRLEKLENHR
jgi:membrane-associated protease RseP (regulator of RpoE activity)